MDTIESNRVKEASDKFEAARQEWTAEVCRLAGIVEDLDSKDALLAEASKLERAAFNRMHGANYEHLRALCKLPIDTAFGE